MCRTVKTIVGLLLFPTIISGQLVLYEPAWNSYPEDQGWERTTFCNPERYLEAGWLVQHVQFGHCSPDEGGELDRYFHSLIELTGATSFFLEWKSYSDGPSEEIIYVAPSNITASSNSGAIENHFTISTDQARYIRDVDEIPHVFVDIEPDIPHVYRLEYQNTGAGWYAWTVDGVLIDEGIPEGPFPGSSPIFHGVTTFRAKSWLTSSTTRWHYIREGEIPVAGSLDFTSDEAIDLLDYYLFRWYFALSGPAVPHSRGWDVGDADDDGDIDLGDLADFQNLFMNGE